MKGERAAIRVLKPISHRTSSMLYQTATGLTEKNRTLEKEQSIVCYASCNTLVQFTNKPFFPFILAVSLSNSSLFCGFRKGRALS